MKTLKPWYIAQMSNGVVQWAGIALMLTPLIIERTGSGSLMGSVMSLIGLFGISAPLIGWLADKYGIHRQMQKVALFSHLLSLVLLYFAQTETYTYLLVGLTIGIGTVSQLVLNPTFVLNSLPENEQARGLSRLFQFQFLGVVIAGSLLGVVSLLGWTSEQKLLMLMTLVCVSIVTVFIAPPPKVKVPEVEQQSDDESLTKKSNKRTSIAFVMFLATVFISMFTASNLMETGPIIIKEVFNVDLGHSAFGLAGSAVLTMILLEPAGRLAEKSSPYLIWMASLACYAVTSIGLWLAIGTNIPSLVPILLIVLLMQAISWFDMVIPAIAEELSPSTPALTQGILMFAMAIGFGVGTYIAGQLIDVEGFVSVVDYCAASIVVTLVLAFATLLFKRK
ncbi:MFS transporter [Vibrio mediterranei]|jgi:MFS family permease|uniref:MFS transporter n=2 Tax=Gammaproteobacteria TaxID=1236 RepID=A0A2S9ZP64_9VIBR|nr:MFS transporter [Vibrio mediterranei]AYV21980.1 MFS transporter [Vibrio mediterranei]MCG9664359.1 MFS transporter [Vibrio mediterranei]NUW71371.1 MFS transporter [Vibrio mediterranei]PCD90472.1 MFS transporter [Vibrio mediterranei]PRQ67559.1 MFS transporter [Vibrio mediterranei]